MFELLPVVLKAWGLTVLGALCLMFVVGLNVWSAWVDAAFSSSVFSSGYSSNMRLHKESTLAQGTFIDNSSCKPDVKSAFDN